MGALMERIKEETVQLILGGTRRILGSRVAEAMQAKGLLHRDLAHRAGLERGQVLAVLNSKAVSLEELIRVALALEVSVEDLLPGFEYEKDGSPA